MHLDILSNPKFAAIFAILCLATRIYLVIFDRKVYSSYPNNFEVLFTLNSSMPFLICSVFILPCIKELQISEFFRFTYALHGLLALLSARAISFGLKSMTVRYVSMISKFADIFIFVFAVLLFVPFELPKFGMLILTTLAYAPMALHRYSSDGIKLLPSFSIIFYLCFQSILCRIFTIPLDDPESILRFILFSMGWRFIFSIIYGSRVEKRKKMLNNRNMLLLLSEFGTKPLGCIMLLLRGVVAFASQSFFFIAVLNQNSLIAWPILNAGPLFASVASTVALNEKMNKTEIASVVMLLLIFIGGFIKWN